MSSPPTVGRIVHYKSYGTPGGEYEPECRAAIITSVGAWVTVMIEDEFPVARGINGRKVVQHYQVETCSLSVHNPTGIFLNEAIRHDEDQQGGTWHWPCVVTP